MNTDETPSLVEYGVRLQRLESHITRSHRRWDWSVRLLGGSAACIPLVLYLGLQLKVMPFGPSIFVLLLLIAGLWLRMTGSMRGIRKSRSLHQHYELGLARATHRWVGRGKTGEEYQDDSHLYSTDLDLFGTGSVFELMCTALTGAGRDTLARWLKEPAARETVLERQSGVEELRNRLDFRETLVLCGAGVYTDCQMETFNRWLDSPSVSFPWWARWVALAMAVTTVAIPVFVVAGLMPRDTLYPLLSICFAVELAFSALFYKSVRKTLEDIRMPSLDLNLLHNLFRALERQHFRSIRLSYLVGSFSSRKHKASSMIARLRRLVTLLEQRQNEMFTIPSYALLWGTQFAMAIENWKHRHGADLRQWLSAIGEVEALVAIATYAFEHPRDPFPELLEGGSVLHAASLGHPLLDERMCVRNDLILGAGTQLLLVSGSNMSGKSTLLRAVGLNAVLAWMGAPVRAKMLTISPLHIGAAIRIQDSLLDGRSHFLAEATRLRAMIDRVDAGLPLLFLIDEILSGTNSHDRLVASRAILCFLVERGAIGLVSTHDLTLTEIADIPDLRGANVHLADPSDSGALDFDYKLRPGTLKGSNALAILRMVNIHV
jgi:hypothetical protein